MARLPYSEKRRGVHLYLPESLFHEVKIILLDPVAGRVGYGKMSSLITTLLTEWVEDKRKGKEVDQPGKDHLLDKFKEFDGE